MKTFEIHITVNSELETFKEFCKLNNIKRIEIESLDRHNNSMDVQHMTSIVQKFNDRISAIKYAMDLSSKLSEIGCWVLRTKVESPIYTGYIPDSLYVETHWKSDQFIYPTSRNVVSNKLLATNREYDKGQYEHFIDFYRAKNYELELCLYDSYLELDSKWFVNYGTIT